MYRPPRLLGERERGLRGGHRMTRIDRQHPDAEARARRRRAIGGEDQEGIAAEAVRDPEAVVAEGVGAPGEVEGGAEITARREERRRPHQSLIQDSASGMSGSLDESSPSTGTLGAIRMRPSTSARR